MLQNLSSKIYINLHKSIIKVAIFETLETYTRNKVNVIREIKLLRMLPLIFAKDTFKQTDGSVLLLLYIIIII